VQEPDEQKVIAEIRKMRGSKMTLRAIADDLNNRGYTSAQGSKWHAESVARALKTPS